MVGFGQRGLRDPGKHRGVVISCSGVVRNGATVVDGGRYVAGSLVVLVGVILGTF